MPAPRSNIRSGDVRRNVKLETEAVYEVVSVGDETVEVIVRVAPGIESGTRLRLSRESVAEMEPVAADTASPRHFEGGSARGASA
jgi:hypothetical protein